MIETENIFLKEKNETLFKLGKIALTKETNRTPELEIIEEDDEDGLDALVQSAIVNRNIGSSSKSVKNLPNAETKAPDQDKKSLNNKTDKNLSKRKIQYCHFFNNYGECKFEKKTGIKCKFAHQKAPLCKFGVQCNHKKCMFSHEKRENTNPQTKQSATPVQPNFLQQILQSLIVPWQTQPPNPWMSQQPWQMGRTQSQL